MSLACHNSFGPVFGHSLSKPVSREIPSRFGPRHCGQSEAQLAHVAVRTTAVTTETPTESLVFMPSLLWGQISSTAQPLARILTSRLLATNRLERERRRPDRNMNNQGIPIARLVPYLVDRLAVRNRCMRS